jgi:hypothetical protein
MTTRMTTMTAIGAVVATMALAGCGQRDRDQAANTTDRTMAQAEQRSDDAGRNANAGVDRARDATRQAAQDAKNATADAGASVSDKVGDAVITTTVKAELAKDSTLSSMRINVDTDSGRVLLRGTAPSAEARTHATALAAAVKGVVSVDNQLTVEAGRS